ncbi:hypothetical protein IFM12275_49050 [Nocardia sputorum]|uniref:Uncharacterized protein n=1 Tax=Nocardia sputorum TaxID=2984338 RepID=A0ABN6UAP3_9NOCA|nr:hypothetical protein IFM12275_49050 [Nocardia sputorum]BDU01820.1 hypothetical protein IFM12276_48480 [Nocardia sputorum]
MTEVPGGTGPPTAISVAMSLRANHTPGVFIGTAQFSGRRVSLVAAAATVARVDGAAGTRGTEVLVDLVMR